MPLTHQVTSRSNWGTNQTSTRMLAKLKLVWKIAVAKAISDWARLWFALRRPAGSWLAMCHTRFVNG